MPLFHRALHRHFRLHEQDTGATGGATVTTLLMGRVATLLGSQCVEL